MTVIRTRMFEGCIDDEPIEALLSLISEFKNKTNPNKYVITLDECDDEDSDIIEVLNYGDKWIELITTLSPKEVRWYMNNYRMGVQYLGMTPSGYRYKIFIK